MATYQARVQQLVGDAGTETDLDDWCNEGAKAVINMMPASLLETISQIASFTSTVSLSGKRIVSVLRNDGTYDRPCRKVPSLFRGRVQDSTDMHYALASDPVFYIEQNAAVVKPDPATDKGTLMYVGYPTIDASSTVFGAVDYFPDEYEYLIVLYAAIKELQNQQSDMKSVLATHNEYDGDSPTDITDAHNGWRAVRYYIETEEDVELSMAEIQALTAEMQQFVARYQWLQQQQVKLQQEWDMGMQLMAQRG